MTFRTIVLTLLLATLTGCGAPKPPLPYGERVPVNPDTASYFEALKNQSNVHFESETDYTQTP